MKILITRTDRLGDLVLSLPALTLLAEARPGWELHVMVAPAAVPLVENNPHVRRVWTWRDDLSRDESQTLSAELRATGFAACVMLQYRRELAGVLRRAGIGRRYGPWSKWSSWFQLNRGLRQNRSRGGRHEMDFNLDLIRRLLRDDGHAADPVALAPDLALSDAQRETGLAFREEFGIEDKSVVFIHPGSGGSALDWEPERFAAVANDLARDTRNRVFVTGSKADTEVVSAVIEHLIPEVGVLLARYDLRDFLAVLAVGDLFIGPSTGPLHMAAALGVPTLGLFPPVPTMHPDRWGPRGRQGIPRENFVPGGECPAGRQCLGQRCPRYNCLAELGSDGIVAAARKILAWVPETESGPGED